MKNKASLTLRPQIIRRLQQAILDSGLTYHQIAEKAGVSTFVISTYMMREPKMPTIETLAALCPVLGVSADWVVLGVGNEPVEVYDCAFAAEPNPGSKVSINDMTAICREALKKYGKLSQVIVANEEMSELTKELCKNLRGEDNKEHIAEEVADVLIMMEQMKLLFDIDSQVDGFMEMKLRRLQDRLEEYDGN